MRAAAFLCPAAVLALCGCVHQLPAPHVAPRLGSTLDVPIGVVTGRSSSLEIMKLGLWGDDSVEAALADARRRGSRDADGIELTAAERRVICFPACAWPLVRSVRTLATANLTRVARGLSAPESERSAPALEVGKAPSTQALLERLEHLYARSPQAAAELHDSLSARGRDELRDEVLSRRGVLSEHGRSFRVPKDADERRRAFLRWYVGSFTTYVLVEE